MSEDGLRCSVADYAKSGLMRGHQCYRYRGCGFHFTDTPSRGKPPAHKIGLSGKTFVTDDWKGYQRLTLEDQLFTDKDLTVPIEQDNINLCYSPTRFRRKTKIVSQAPDHGRFVTTPAESPVRPCILCSLCQNS